LDHSSLISGRYLFVGFSVIQTLVFIDIVNSEPITVCEPEVDGFEGVAIDYFFEFRKMAI
jgi:hypothetical protein